MTFGLSYWVMCVAEMPLALKLFPGPLMGQDPSLPSFFLSVTFDSAQCLCAKQSSRRSVKWKSLSLSLCKQEQMQICLEVDLGSANRLPLPPTLALKIFDKDEKWQINGPLCFFCLVIYITRFTISWKLWFRDYSIRLPKEAENIIRRTLIHCKSISSRKCLIYWGFCEVREKYLCCSEY